MNTLEEVSSIVKRLMLLEPFYGIFASSLNKVTRKDVPTAGVCKHNINYQLAVNEEFWASLDSDNKKPETRDQLPIDRKSVEERIERTAVLMGGERYLAVKNSNCQFCAVSTSCPLQIEGRGLYD